MTLEEALKEIERLKTELREAQDEVDKWLWAESDQYQRANELQRELDAIKAQCNRSLLGQADLKLALASLKPEPEPSAVQPKRGWYEKQERQQAEVFRARQEAAKKIRS